jgi:uncharacterized membrane-anchored protein YjiN (DUF445 family)
MDEIPAPAEAAVPTFGQGREADQRAALARMRLIATGLLVAMTAVFAAATHWETLHPVLPFVRAFAEAAMIGALADWFAVTALFRHPLGLPIPHTAIVPRNKDRIGIGLGTFVAENFLAPDLVTEKVASLDISGRLQRWLSSPANRRIAALRVTQTLPDLIGALDDEDVGRFLERNISARIASIGLAPLAGEVLALLTADGQHQRLVDEVLAALRTALRRNRGLIDEKVRERSPWWLPKAIDAEISERIVAGIDETLADFGDPKSLNRARLERALVKLIDDLRHDPKVRARGEEWLAQVFGNPTVRAYFRDLAATLKARILADATSPESAIGRQIEGALAVYADTIASDPGIKAKLEDWIQAAVRQLAVTRRHDIGAWIATVVSRWDTRTAVDKMELEVGRDLQFIRINGTLVGGLIGLAIHVAALAIG